jgi:undecaprenyl diphosphate synthase
MTAELSIQNVDFIIPSHVAIIMDGNGRWAEARGLPRIAGHREGAAAVKLTIESAIKYGVRYLTLFSFSSENWKRPLDEVNGLMGLLRRYLRSEIAELHKNGVRLRVIGERLDLASDIVNLIEDCERQTVNNTTLDLVIALSYGSRKELTNAFKIIAKKSISGDITVDEIDEITISKHLESRDIPDPDLLIRTSGEKRISNFLLWQLAYAELIFVDCLWPDFNEAEFENAIYEFSRRERRFGTTI